MELKQRVSYVVTLVGLGAMTGAVALNGPIVGAAASPLAPVMLIGGGAIFAVGLVLIVAWRKR